MDYENKHKEEVVRATQLWECGDITRENLEYIFPELAESEDERIRKWLICGMNALKDQKNETFATIPIDDCIAWLEKQGEKTKWTDEDERVRNGLIALLKFGLEDGSAIAPGFNETKEQALAWLENQGDTNEIIDRDKLAQGVLRGAAINLITWIDYNAAEGNMCLSNMECKDIENALVSGDWNKIYAYIKKKLERQDGQKSIFDFNANNWYVSKVDGKIHNIYNSGVEPKFNVGDWVVYNRNDSSMEILYIYDIRDGRYYFNDNIHFSWSVKECDERCHLWTIDDATDGDVLSYVTDEEDLWIMIFWSLYEPYEGHVHYHALLVNDDFSDKGTCCICINDLKPATKEQHDLLFSKMKKEGYLWDEVNKKLTKNIGDVERIQYDSLNCQKNIVLKWSEEDDKILVKIITALMDANNVECVDFNVMYNWLISIKEWRNNNESIH